MRAIDVSLVVVPSHEKCLLPTHQLRITSFLFLSINSLGRVPLFARRSGLLRHTDGATDLWYSSADINLEDRSLKLNLSATVCIIDTSTNLYIEAQQEVDACKVSCVYHRKLESSEYKLAETSSVIPIGHFKGPASTCLQAAICVLQFTDCVYGARQPACNASTAMSAAPACNASATSASAH